MSVQNWVASENSRRAFMLYKKAIKWAFATRIRRRGGRAEALLIRKEFEEHRNETDPQKIEFLFQRAEYWAAMLHGTYNPIIYSNYEGGTAFLRNVELPREAIKIHSWISEHPEKKE